MSTLHLPNEASETLQRAFGPNLDRAALEALAIEGYRAAKLTAGEVAHVLGLGTSLAAQKWLADHIEIIKRCLSMRHSLLGQAIAGCKTAGE